MSPRVMKTGARRRLEPGDRREELLVAGERVVRRLGLAAQIADVTAEAGAARATFYVYFVSWEDFLFELRERAFEALEARFDAYLAAEPDWSGRVRGLPALFVDMTLELEQLHAALFHGPIAQRRPSGRFDVIARLRGLLAEGVAAGALDVADPGEAAHLVFAMLHAAADRVEAGVDRARAAAACETMLARALGA